MKLLFATILAIAALAPTQAQRQRTFTGTITDEMCAGIGHSHMRMGPTDAECTKMCVMAHASAYVLEVDAKTVYVLSDQAKPADFAAQKVTVTGTLDSRTRTIQVASIRATR